MTSIQRLLTLRGQQRPVLPNRQPIARPIGTVLPRRRGKQNQTFRRCGQPVARKSRMPEKPFPRRARNL